MVSETDIRKMAEIIAAKFQPEKIILFGSYARGTATRDSDVDLLVISSSAVRRREQASAMRTVVSQIPGAKDILVCTPNQFEPKSISRGSVLYEAMTEGKVLFSRA